MGKIKINLTSGNVIEKPLVTAFKTQTGNYIILDNEANGSMGLPIICVSKFNGSTAEKIVDQNEWGQAKEYLKSLIAGTKLEFMSVPETISAADDFFTQLTLPLASFDVLRSTYAPAVAQPVEAAPTLEAVSAPVETAPVENPTVVEPNLDAVNLTIPPVSPVIPSVPVMPVTPAPVVPSAPVMPVTPVSAVAPVTAEVSPIVAAPTVEPAAPVMPVPGVEQPVTNVVGTNDFAQMKETFLKSCENMFDALVKEFQNK